MTIDIRGSRAEDREGVRGLVQAAFAVEGRDGRNEVDIVEATWRLAHRDGTWDLVAVEDGSVVGHVLAALGDVDRQPLAAIAPLAVRPDRQGRGIGSALIERILGSIRESGWPAVVVLGSPRYYARFEFEEAEPIGILYPGHRGPAFQIRRFDRDTPLPRGSFRYCWEPAPPIARAGR